MTGVLTLLIGALLVGGPLLLVAGLRSTSPVPTRARATRPLRARWAQLSHRPPGAAGRRRDAVLGVGVVAGLVVAALTGWVIAVVFLPAAAVVLPVILRSPTSTDVALLEALDRWVRTLATTLPTGRSISDAVRLSRRTAPELLAEPISVLVARLNGGWSNRDALQGLADDLDSPDADGVIAALMLAAERGSTGAAATLAELADSIQRQLAGRREVETERQKPYVVVRQVTVISLVTLAVFLGVGRAFFAPYGTPLGQLLLGLLLFAYLGTLMFMRVRSRPPRRDRILVRAVR